MRSFALAAVAVVLVSCFAPHYDNGHVLCALTGTACPQGYHCAADNTCWKNGQDPLANDMGGMCQVDIDCNMPPNTICYSPIGSCANGACSYVPKASCSNGDCCAPIHGSCDAACAITCDSGFADCDGKVSTGCETDVTSDPGNCSACGHSCDVPTNGTATCTMGTCGVRCNSGFVPSGTSCVGINAPRPKQPLSTSTVTSHRPTFKWEAGMNATGARVEISRDRTFTTGVVTVDSNSASAAPSTDLTAGHYFWRLRGLVGADAGIGTSAIWEFTVNNQNAPVDTSYGTSLDLDGDGFSDVATYADGGGTPEILLYRGGKGASGLPSNATPDLAVMIPDPVSNPNTLALRSAGDVNGDGYADLVVGSPDTTVGGNAEAGTVYVLYGGANVFTASPTMTVLNGPDGANANFGNSVDAVGDVDGDGYGDIVVGSVVKAYVFRGSASGIASGMAPSFTLTDAHSPVAGAGDTNGDGYGDIIVGDTAYNSGAGSVAVYLGGPSGPPMTSSRRLPATGTVSAMGTSVASAGDVNGDGYADVMGTANLTVYVYYGAANGFNTGSGGYSASLTSPTTGTQTTTGFGFRLLGAGDFNGDGFGDVVITDGCLPNKMTGTCSYQGIDYLFLSMGPSGLTSVLGGSRSTASATWNAPSSRLQVGRSVSAGDINGDGLADILVFAAGDSSFAGEGLLFDGASTPPVSATVPFLQPTSSTTGVFGPGAL